MGTFIVSFIGNSLVRHASDARPLAALQPSTRRKALVVCYFAAIVAAAALFGVLTIPDIVREGADFVQRLKSDSIWVVVLEKVRAGVGDGMMDQVERFLLVAAGDEAVAKGVTWATWTPDRAAYLGTVRKREKEGKGVGVDLFGCQLFFFSVVPTAPPACGD